MITKLYKILPDYTEKWLDKVLTIEGYNVDAFRLSNIYKSTAEIFFLRREVPAEYSYTPAYKLPEHIRNNAFLKIIQKNKRITFVDGEMIISINGLKYCIGKYKEV